MFSDGFVCFVCLNWVPVKTFTRVRICQGAEISTRSRPSGREFRYATFTSHGMGLIFRILNTFFKTPPETAIYLFVFNGQPYSGIDTPININ